MIDRDAVPAPAARWFCVVNSNDGIPPTIFTSLVDKVMALLISLSLFLSKFVISMKCGRSTEMKNESWEKFGCED